jgi:acyl-CoA hydrolase/CheY-like chemotaxis protein
MNPTVLLVDNDKGVLEACEGALQELHAEVLKTDDPAQGLAILKESKVDVLITNISMPGMSGLDLMKQGHKINAALQVIVMTGFPDIKEAVTAMQEGAFHYLTKPVACKELKETVTRALEEAAKAPQPATKAAPVVASREPSWMHEYRSKVCSPEEAVSIIKDGENVFISANSATPLTMQRALYNQRDRFKRLNLVHVLLAGEDILNVKDPASPFRHVSLFVGPADRDAVNAGLSEYMPIFLYEIPGLFTQGYVKLDTAILHVSVPDEHGFVSVGVEGIATLAAAEKAGKIIAQVNDQMPYILGDNFIHVSRFNKIVEVSDPILELKEKGSTETEKKIGAFVAELIPDGATMQMGIGGIPNAVLANLEGRRDIGIHTEMISDGLITAFERGIITNARKAIHKGKIIGTFVYGTKKLYDFVDKNPIIELHPVSYVNDPRIICQNSHMVAVNSCIELDITGQVCSDSIGTRIYSGFGGQVDFIRGAGMAKDGKPIIALPATTKNDTLSRIVPKLKPGAGVVTSRGDVHWVVTEFGRVNLHGRTLQERARLLVEIAHPNFRDMLIQEAKERKIW